MYILKFIFRKFIFFFSTVQIQNSAYDQPSFAWSVLVDRVPVTVYKHVANVGKKPKGVKMIVLPPLLIY